MGYFTESIGFGIPNSSDSLEDIDVITGITDLSPSLYRLGMHVWRPVPPPFFPFCAQGIDGGGKADVTNM